MVNLVHIDDMTFDAEGTGGFIYSKLTGWLSSPPMRAVVEDRPNGDGAFDVDRDFRAARVITFEGGLVGANLEDAAENFYDRFAALQSNGVPFTFAVERDWGTRSCEVSLMDVAEVDAVSDGLVASVMAQFVARDPLKYAPASSTPTNPPTSGGGLEYNLHSGGAGGALYYGANGDLGRVALTNTGTAATWPSFVVAGLVNTGFYLQCLETGQMLRYDRVVSAGSTVTLDSRTGEVLIDGVSDASGSLTISDWFSVPAMSSVTVQFNPLGSTSGATMTATVRSAWW